MTLLVSELDKLSLTLDFIGEGQAQQVISLINDRLFALLEPHIIDVVWKQEAEDGVVLIPLDSATVDRTDRRGAKVFHIREGSTEPTGIWAWVYKNCGPVWIEDITKSPSTINGLYRTLEKQIINRCGQIEIPQRYLSFYRDTDSILAVPLVTKNFVRGVYSIELSSSGRFTEERVSLIEKLSKS